MGVKREKHIQILVISILMLNLIGFSLFSNNILAICISDKGLNIHNKTSISNTSIEEKQISNVKAFSNKFFYQNKGQIKNNETMFYFMCDDSTYSYEESSVICTKLSEKQNTIFSYKIQFETSNNVKPIGLGKNDFYINYFVGSVQITDIYSFQEIFYPNIYDGIDLKYYLTPNGLKYEFIVKPGSNPNQIRISLDDSLKLETDDFKIEAYSKSENRLVFQDQGLKVFQENEQNIHAQFYEIEELNGYGFDIGEYDISKELIIDPYLINFSTYLGGNDTEQVKDVLRDSMGNIIIGGSTLSPDFIICNSYQSTLIDYEAFITKLDPTGTSILFSTFIGGDGVDTLTGLTLDENDNIYILGGTYSTDYPTANPYQTDQTNRDIFVTKLNSTGKG